METKKFIMENIKKNIDLDLGDVMKEYINTLAKTKDKEIIADLMKHNENLNHELTMRLIEHSERVTEKAAEIFVKQEASYMQGGKMQKVLGFAKWSAISDNAFRAAISDVKQIVSIANPMDEPEVKETLYIRKQMQIVLGSHISNMFADNPAEKLNFKGIDKVLGFNGEE